MRRGDFSDSFHTYGLEWDDKYSMTLKTDEDPPRLNLADSD